MLRLRQRYLILIALVRYSPIPARNMEIVPEMIEDCSLQNCPCLFMLIITTLPEITLLLNQTGTLLSKKLSTAATIASGASSCTRWDA